MASGFFQMTFDEFYTVCMQLFFVHGLEIREQKRHRFTCLSKVVQNQAISFTCVTSFGAPYGNVLAVFLCLSMS